MNNKLLYILMFFVVAAKSSTNSTKNKNTSLSEEHIKQIADFNTDQLKSTIITVIAELNKLIEGKFGHLTEDKLKQVDTKYNQTKVNKIIVRWRTACQHWKTGMAEEQYAQAIYNLKILISLKESLDKKTEPELKVQDGKRNQGEVLQSEATQEIQVSLQKLREQSQVLELNFQDDKDGKLISGDKVFFERGSGTFVDINYQNEQLESINTVILKVNSANVVLEKQTKKVQVPGLSGEYQYTTVTVKEVGNELELNKNKLIGKAIGTLIEATSPYYRLVGREYFMCDGLEQSISKIKELAKKQQQQSAAILTGVMEFLRDYLMYYGYNGQTTLISLDRAFSGQKQSLEQQDIDNLKILFGTQVGQQIVDGKKGSVRMVNALATRGVEKLVQTYIAYGKALKEVVDLSMKEVHSDQPLSVNPLIEDLNLQLVTVNTTEEILIPEPPVTAAVPSATVAAAAPTAVYAAPLKQSEPNLGENDVFPV